MEYSANSGKISNTKSTNYLCIAGLVSDVGGYADNGEDDSNMKSYVNYSVNFGEVSGLGNYYLGGTLAFIKPYCYHVGTINASSTKVTINGKNVTNTDGESPYYIGRRIGYKDSSTQVTALSSSGKYYSNVYEVVNGMSNTESTIWSNSNVDKPTLLWETSIK